jgi:hypothetical protein
MGAHRDEKHERETDGNDAPDAIQAGVVPRARAAACVFGLPWLARRPGAHGEEGGRIPPERQAGRATAEARSVKTALLLTLALLGEWVLDQVTAPRRAA